MTNRCFIFLLGSLFTLVACSKESSGGSGEPSASVSIYAMVPDAPQLNLFLNGYNIAAGVPFGSFTLYDHVVPGTVVLKAQSLSQNVIVDTSFSIVANQYYSLFLTGSLSAIKPVVLHDSFGSFDSGYAGLRFLVLSPGVSNIDFHVVKDSTVNKIAWNNRSFTDNMTNDSINKFIPFAAGTYSFYAIQTNNTTDTIARFTNKTFSDSSNYTLMLEGFYNKAAGDTTLLLGTRLH